MKPTKSSMLKKTVIATTVSVVSLLSMTSVLAANNILNTVPHVYEFVSENPGGGSYYWCGHAALKIAMQYKGTNKTLSQINATFQQNSPAGFAANTYCGSENPGKSWCAKLQDLMWAAGKSQNGGYGRAGIKIDGATTYGSASQMYTSIKTEINASNPVIMPANVVYGVAGHFWVIVGYSDGYNDATNTIYVRDVAMSSPTNGQYDRTFFAPDFFNKSYKQALIIK